MEVGGCPERPDLHHFGHMFFCMRFGRHFLQNLSDLGSHWAPFGEALGALLAYFWALFSGSDFRSIFGMLLGGAGGRGGVPETSESEESA